MELTRDYIILLAMFFILLLVTIYMLLIILGIKNKIDRSQIKVEKIKIPINDIMINAEFLYPKYLLDPQGNPTKNLPLIFFNHGWNNDINILMPAAVGLCIGGPYAGLIYECRGHGKSGGKKRFNEQLFNDIPEIITYGSKIKGVDPNRMGFIGISMGGMIALTRAYKDTRIKAILAMCAPYNLKNIFKNPKNTFMQKIGQGFLTLTTPIHINKITEETNKAVSPEYHLEKGNDALNRRVLIMHAKNDMLVPFYSFENIKEVLNPPEDQYLVFNKGNHGFFLQHTTIFAKAMSFFKEKL